MGKPKPLTKAKAYDLIRSGNIAEMKGARTFAVRDGEYHVIIDDAGQQFCTCPAGVHGIMCYHIAAAITMIEVEREDQ